jgi:cold shock protein
VINGTVKWYNPQKGVGLIRTDAGGDEVFVYITAVKSADVQTLVEGQKLSFDLMVNKRTGEFSAEMLKLEG